MLFCLRSFAIFVITALHTSNALAGSATYRLVPERSTLFAQVFRDWNAPLAFMSHDHVIRASEWEGTARFDPRHLEDCQVSIRLPVDALRADEPFMRTLVNYAGTLSAKQRSGVEKDLRSATQVDAAEHPWITFTSNRCEVVRDGYLTMEGALEVRGQRKLVTVPIDYALSAEHLVAWGAFTVTTHDFGFAPYSALLGGLRNGEDIHITLNIVGETDDSVTASAP